MMTNPRFGLKRQAYIALLISAAFPVLSFAVPAGRVEFVVGGVSATDIDGKTRLLTKGSEVNAGDTIVTSDGRAQVRFTDGGYVSFQPQTRFTVDEYNYNGKSDGSEKGVFKFIEGGLRVITGAIGKTHRQNYRMSTPVATIGIRGTEFIATYSVDGQQLYMSTVDGAVYVQNDKGDMVLYAGQSGVVSGSDAPAFTDNQPGVASRGPDDTQENQDEQNKNQQDQTVFTVNEQYNDDGSVKGLTDTSTNTELAQTLAAIATYASANADGIYTLQSSTGSSSTYTSDFKLVNSQSISTITVHFGTGDVDANLTLFAQDSASSYSTGFSGSSVGTLNKTTAGLVLTNVPLSSSGGMSGCSYGGCVLNATGALSGATANQANINFNVKSTSSATTAIGTGSASFTATSIGTSGL